ncbi:MAG: nuclear transport factor 2 family protein [Pseudomonadota bacterium]
MSVADRLDIEQNLNRYAHYMDSGQNDQVATRLFAEDASVDAGLPTLITGRQAIHDFYTASPMIPLLGVNAEGVCHMMTNIIVDVQADRARSNARVLCFFWSMDGGSPHRPADSVLLGAYQDDHVRTAAGWRIQHRRVCSFGTSVAAGRAPDYLSAIVDGVAARLPDWP